MAFFDKLRDQELLAHYRQDPYVRTHPINSDRILRLNERVTKSPHFDKPTPAEDEYWFNRVKAKLDGYVNPPNITFRDYPTYDTSEFARYARVYGYQHNLQFEEALQEANHLLSLRPDDPFYNEIAGQILFERGKAEESIPYLEKAHASLPREPLIMTSLGNAYLALETDEGNLKAMEILEQSVFFDPYNDLTWGNLARVYAKVGMEAKANLATAEQWVLERRYPGAIRRAQQALRDFPEGSREWLQAEDILLTATQLLEKYGPPRRRVAS
jgi:predicted Zn-dependent protease